MNNSKYLENIKNLKKFIILEKLSDKTIVWLISTVVIVILIFIWINVAMEETEERIDRIENKINAISIDIDAVTHAADELKEVLKEYAVITNINKDLNEFNDTKHKHSVEK